MQIKNEKSSANDVRNGANGTWDVGGPSHGYCGLHDMAYKLTQGDETCPHCDAWQVQDLAWRDAEDVHSTSGDDMGDSDEE